MRILQVCPRYYPNIGGVEECVRRISEILAKIQYDVSVFTTDPTGKLPTEGRKLIHLIENRRCYYSSYCVLLLW